MSRADALGATSSWVEITNTAGGAGDDPVVGADGEIGAVAEAIADHLRTAVAVVVRGLGVGDDHRRLEAVGRLLGTPSTNDVASPRSPVVHKVEPTRRPKIDGRGQPILSTTSQTFPCHSDDFLYRNPADLVLLQCVRAAACGGGRTLLAPAAEIVRLLPDATLDLMRAPVWPTEDGHDALLRGSGDDARLRYSVTKLNEGALPQPLVAARTEIEAAVAEATRALRLDPGDLIVIDNARTLHGRTSMRPRSGRLFYRMRVFTP